MPYALSTQGQGATAYAVLPSWAINPNTQTGVNWIEIDFILHGPADNGIGYIFGSSGSTIFSVSVDATNKLRLVLSSVVITEPVGTFVYGQRYTLRLEYNDTGSASTAWTRLYLNGTQVGSDYTGATSNISINQIGRYSTTRHSPITIFSLKTGSSTPAAVGYVDEWNDSTALGTGTTWPSVASTRNITITNATGLTNSWWINYGSVSEHTVAINSVYPQYSATVTITNDKPVYTTDINANYPVYTVSVNATVVSNNRSLSINAVYPAYSANVTVSNTKPVFNAAVNSTYAQYSASVSANNTKPVYSSSVNTTYPKYTAAVNATIQPSGYSCTINATYPVYTASITTSNTKPVKTVNINVTYPVYTGSVTNTNTKPIYTANVTASYSKYTANVIATIAGINSLSINTSYPKYTASVACDTVNLENTISINATYPKYVGVVVLGDFVNLPRIGGKGAHINILSGSREIKVKDKSRNVKWRVENARL